MPLVAVAAWGLLVASTAFACIPIAVLQLTPPAVAPGGTVHALILEVSGSQVPPVTFHFNAVDGPVLATVQPGDNDTEATFTIPANTPGGDYVIYATQPFQEYQEGQFPTWGMPAKALLHVITGNSAAPIYGGDSALQTQVRPAALVTSGKGHVSTATVLIIGGITLVVALVIVLGVVAFSRNRSSAQTSEA
ncbi:MAG: hypothetical protein ACRDZ8_21900 [Acidimicrobiales bacterium]